MWDGLQIIKAVIDAEAAIKVLDRSYIDLATPLGRRSMAMMSAMANDQRFRIIKRTGEGRQLARAKGVKMGRKPKLTPHRIEERRGSALPRARKPATLGQATASAATRFRGCRRDTRSSESRRRDFLGGTWPQPDANKAMNLSFRVKQAFG
jgi:DNA invertase Pin-like site-specific DNA recombinase